MTPQDPTSPAPQASGADASGASAGDTLGQGAKLLVEVGPIFVFMVTYNVANRSRPDEAIFIATAVFIAATLAALAYAWLHQRRVPLMLVVTAVIVTVFGGLTLALQDAIFVKIKPTIVNLLYAAAIFGSLLVGRNIWKLLFSQVFTLPDRIWNILAARWGAWFVFLAVLNEFIWRNFSEAFWANFKFWGVMPLTIAFAMANLPITMKHSGQDGPGGDTKSESKEAGDTEAGGAPTADDTLKT